MAGFRGRAKDDLRVDKKSGVRPGILQMLFAGGGVDRPRGEEDMRTRRGARPTPLWRGGSADKQMASDDTRMGRDAGVRPSAANMLFRGGSTADDDLRTDTDDNEPTDEEMLSEGGEAGDGPEVSDELIMAAEDVMDSLMGGGFYGDKINEGDSKVEKASKEASRRAKAKILAQSLKAFFDLCE